MDRLTIQAIDKSIDEMLNKNQTAISQNLFNNTTESMTTEKVTALLVMNCLSLSIKISVQTILNLLQESEILEIDEHQIAKLLLKQLSSEIME